MTTELTEVAAALGVPRWILLVVMSGVVGAVIVVAGRYVLRHITWGNPQALAETARVLLKVRSAPPTSLFRWRVRAGLQVVVYDPDADEERELPSGIKVDRHGPGLIFWMWGDRPRSVEFVTRRATYDLAVRFLLFFWMFLGSFVVIFRLAFTVSWHWAVALVFLAIQQLASARTKRYIEFVHGRHFVAMGVGVFVYLQGGIFETIAVYAVGAYFVIFTLATWYWIQTVSRRHLIEELLSEKERR